MSSGGSVTNWIGQLGEGDSVAAQQLWKRYFQQLVGLARQKLRHVSKRAADEEDVALSAFDSFFRGAAHGRFPQLADRDDLWRLLVVITARKASHCIRDEHREKRGGGEVLGESALDGPTKSAADQPGLEQIIGHEPTPEFAAEMAEEYQRLLSSLGDKELESVAFWKMEGYTNHEISEKLGCAPRTVERKLALIRRIWSKADVSP